MDTDDIAAILKDAINASSTKIQNESKRTNIFVLPPELLKGLLHQNETPKVDDTSKAGTSNSKDSKSTTKNKKQFLEDKKSNTLPVDRPRRSANRQCTESKGSKSTTSQTSLKNNSKDLKKKEQNHEQNTVIENNETHHASNSTEKSAVQKKSNHRKGKAKKESEPSDLCNVESSSNILLDDIQVKIESNHELGHNYVGKAKKGSEPLDLLNVEPTSSTISDEVQEKIENNLEFKDNSIGEVSDNPPDNWSAEKSSSKTSDKLEEKCIENNHEQQDCLNNEISKNSIPENDLANIETVDLNFEEKSCDETSKVANSKTDQVLQDSHMEIFQSDASQKMSIGKILTQVELHDENVSLSEPIQWSNDEKITVIEEETYIVEEIIELIESDEDSIQVENYNTNMLEEINIKTEEDLPIKKIESSKPIDKTEGDLPVENIELSQAIHKTEDLPVENIELSKPINNLLNTKSKSISKRVPNSFKPIVEQKRPNAIRVYANKRKNTNITSNNEVQGRSFTQINHNCGEDSLINKTLEEITLENSFDISQNSEVIQEKTNLEINSDFDHDNLADTLVTETPVANSFEGLESLQKVQEKSNSEIECNSDQNSMTNSALMENQCQKRKYSKKVKVQPNVETNLPNKISDPVDTLVGNVLNHTESREEIEKIENIEKTNNTHEKWKNQTEPVEMKVHNTRSPRKSANAKINAQSDSEAVKIVNEGMEIDAESTKNTELGKLENHLTDNNANKDVEENTNISGIKRETSIPCKNDDLGKSKDYWENEIDCSIKSLRQLRNRTKVVPKDPANFNKLKDNIAKESLHLMNGDKSDIVLRNNYEVRTRSVSLNLELNSPEKSSPSAKKISRKSMSIDNYLKNESRMSTLRRRDAEELRRSESKSEKIIVVRKIQKGRRSKSSQPKDDSTVATIVDKKNSKSNHIDDNSKNIDSSSNITVEKNLVQMEIPKAAKNKIQLEDNVGEKSNNSAVDSLSCQMDISVTENAAKIKSEKGSSAKKGRRGTRAKSISSNEKAAEHTSVISENNQTESTDDLIDREQAAMTTDSRKADENTVDTSNVDHQVENALEVTDFKIKTEKVTPAKKGRRGRRLKSIPTNEVPAKNAKGVFNINKNSHQLENSDDLNVQQSQAADANTKLSTSECNFVGTSNAGCLVENAVEESTLKIKTEKVTPVKKVGRGRRSKSIPSNIFHAENTKDNVDINENSHELESAGGLHSLEEAFTNKSTDVCDQKDSVNVILPTDHPDKCSFVDAAIAEPQVENALADSSLTINTEKVSSVKRGRKGRRSKSKPSTNNVKKQKYEDDCNSSEINISFEASEYFPTTNSTVANEAGASTNIPENTEVAGVPDDFDEKPECSLNDLLKINFETNNASAEISSTATTQQVSTAKKGRRGRRPKSSQMNDSVEKRERENDCMPSLAENNADLETDKVAQLEDVKPSSSAEISINIDMEIELTTHENNATHDSNLHTIGVDNEVNEKPGKRVSKLPRQSSRHDKQEPSASNTRQSNKRSSRTSAKRNRTNSDDASEEDSSYTEVRKSGRRQRSTVNYRVPDEDFDVHASETQARQKPVENAPKKRRGRPSRAAILKMNASVEEIVEQVQPEITQEDTNLDPTVNDSNSPAVDAVNTSTRRRRTTKSTINEDIFEVELEPSTHAKSKDTSQHVSDAENDTNDFEDSHFSDKHEDEDVIEECKPRRGRKRKYVFKVQGAKKRGRPKKDEVESNDEEYTPHHSYVPQPAKVKEKAKAILNKKVIKCGKCGKETPRHQWYSHNLFTHNDMGWLEGSEKPDFENDQKLLMRVLTQAHKKKHKKGLVCEACREVKKSVVGFISHITFCGKTEEEVASLLVTCEICKATFKPSSMEYHERQHRLEGEIKMKKEKEAAEKVIDIFEPRSKRKAAEKAVNKISEFTAIVKEDDVFSGKRMKLNSPQIKKFIQKPQATKKISSLTIAKWRKELDNKQDAACTQLGCQFTCKSMDEMREHYSSCNFTVTQNYVCKVCRYQTPFEDDIIQHAQKHTSEDLDGNAAVSGAEASSDEDYSDFEVDESSNQGPDKTRGLVRKFFYKETSDVANKMFKFIFNNGACHTVLSKTFLSGVQWTLEFERKHFKFSILNNFVPNTFTLLEGNDAKDYLPELDQSMPVRFTKTDGQSGESEWKNWSRFEGRRVDDSPTFFVGGPIWAMAWAPTPSFFAISDDLPQFLAVSTHPTMDSEYTAGKSYSGKNIIQIWSLGSLNNRTLSESDPELSYAITHDGGTIWSLEWCPSGCYQHEDSPFLKGENDSNRLGLLAAGCSDGCVRIYSLIFPENLHSPSKNQCPIYKTEPVAKLIVNTEIHNSKGETWQVLKLCWSREANHNVIVAGFSNGYVAFWDLTTKSPLLKYQVDDTTFFRPYKQFFAHHHAVTMLALVPQDNKRYLATASLDKLYKFWDLEDISRPKNTFKKSYVTDGCWFNNWYCAVLAHDEALCMGHNASVVLPLRDYTYKYYNLLPSNSTTYAIGTSDYANSFATGNVAGELLTLFPHQIIYIRDMEKTIPPKRSYSLVSTTEVVDFKAQPANNSPVKKDKKATKKDPYINSANFMPSTYKDSKDRFGIQFNNYMNSFHTNSKKKQKYTKKQMLTCEHLEKTAIEQYPLKSINKVAWNPNASSFLWLAAGYQNGFVRLISFRSVASTAEWNKMLQSHTNALKAQMDEEAAEDDC